MDHIKALDGWRGICAILVVLFHFSANSHFYDLSIIRHASLFVDFFFVLSGFVMAGNYQQKLLDGMSTPKFMWLRFVRLYPLHIFILLVFFFTELAFMNFVNEFSGIGRQAFEGRYSLDAFLANIFLLQGMGVYDHLTWNGPSWSISTEFYTYLLLAIFARHRAVFIVFLILTPCLLYDTVEAGSRFWYILRCIAGFSGGVIVYQIFQKYKLEANSLMEIAIVVLIVAMTEFIPSPYSYMLAPFLFAIAVYVFAHEKGIISQYLSTKPLQFLGKISFSVYMVHTFLQLRIFNLAMLAENYGFEIITYKDGKRYLGTNEWLGDLSYLLMLAVVIFISWVTYTHIEVKGGKLLKKLSV
ncbi:acyltransferase [Kordiimonas sp. SCSIO 12610]|uniref:acyltransferase family protein n=1 Tax=Kordiimonas sp. SCSIO 12610 TaxID=2829597 RepID=UPI00210BE35F|nr:acyltransferase [Kordiimonas sp. SCSIO 12610]UTW56179.1 acyltransferase [Kordiimonas sp. SCSIO 12610]